MATSPSHSIETIFPSSVRVLENLYSMWQPKLVFHAKSIIPFTKLIRKGNSFNVVVYNPDEPEVCYHFTSRNVLEHYGKAPNPFGFSNEESTWLKAQGIGMTDAAIGSEDQVKWSWVAKKQEEDAVTMVAKKIAEDIDRDLILRLKQDIASGIFDKSK